MQNFRVAVLATIAFLAFLMAAVAVVAVVFDVNDRGLAIIGVVLAALPTLVTSLIVYLKVENVEHKADSAAINAAAASRKVAEVHHDLLNGGLRDNVKRAIHEAEEDPELQAIRVDVAARGVQHDRHETASREASAYSRGVQEGMQRQWKNRPKDET